MQSKKQKGGNKRLNAKSKPGNWDEEERRAKEELREQFEALQTAENMEELIELTRSENETIRLRAAQMMCPCKVEGDVPEFWARIFELAEDPSEKVRY